MRRESWKARIGSANNGTGLVARGRSVGVDMKWSAGDHRTNLSIVDTGDYRFDVVEVERLVHRMWMLDLSYWMKMKGQRDDSEEEVATKGLLQVYCCLVEENELQGRLNVSNTENGVVRTDTGSIWSVHDTEIDGTGEREMEDERGSERSGKLFK